MKSLFAIVIVSLLSVSCSQEEIPSYDKLTQAERDAIDSMSETQCLAQTETAYAGYKSNSNIVFTSTNYQRGDGFEFLFKLGTTTEKTVNIQVWKQTETELYFLINDSRASSDYFLRITKAENEQLIDDLRTVHCDKPLIYLRPSVNNNTIVMVNEYNVAKTGTNRDYYADTYTLGSGYPAFFANYQVGRTRTEKDVDLNAVGNSDTYTSTLTAKTFTFASDVSTSGYVQKYCKFMRGTSGYRFVTERNVEGFLIELNNPLQCSTTVPSGWDMTVI